MYPDPTERQKHNYFYYLPEVILEKSTRAQEYKDIEKSLNQLDTAISLLILAAILIWPLAVIYAGIWWLKRYWKGEGIDEGRLQVRQNLMRTGGTIIVAAFLTTLVIAWRFLATQVAIQPEGLVTIAICVAIVGCVFVITLWRLMASPMSRLSSTLKSSPISYRFALMAVVIAGVAFITGGDLKGYQDTNPIILLSVEAAAWLALTVSVGSVMLGYMRLPVEMDKKQVEKQQEKSVSPPKQQETVAVNDKPLPDEVIEPVKVYEKLSTLISLVESFNHRETNGTGQTSKRARAQRSDEVVRQRGEAVRQRLLTEVQSLTRRGNLNLTIGSLTSLIAATILWMLVAQAPTSVHETTALIGYYVPRLSVAVFIEIFSFFFLRLYKNGLSEIMYYQNELTNLESKMLALEIASLLPSADSVQHILQDLAKTDRNMILRSGESTVELEKIKADQQNVQSLFDTLISKMTDVKEAIKVRK